MFQNFPIMATDYLKMPLVGSAHLIRNTYEEGQQFLSIKNLLGPLLQETAVLKLFR